jgi:hypothetical protein
MYPKVSKPLGKTFKSLQELDTIKNLFPEKAQTTSTAKHPVFVKKQQSS